MTIRRMRSMSGIRRMWSDYGFEGFLRPENLTRSANVGLYTAGIVTLALSGVVFSTRRASTEPTLLKWASDIEACAARGNDRTVEDALLKALDRNGLNVQALEVAGSHLTPVEAQALAASRLVSHLRSEYSAHQSLIEDCPDPIVRQIAERSSAVTSSVDALVAKIFDDLVLFWAKQRYFDPASFPDRSVFRSRETGEAIGVDIGCTVESALTAKGANVLTADQVATSARMTEQWGFSVVKHALSEQQVALLKQELELDQGPASGIGERITRMDANISHSRAMPNRLHLVLRGSKLESLTASAHIAIAPLVSLLQSRRDPGGERLMVSDVRLVVVDQAAEAINWTVFNPRGGYTAIIPLHDRNSRDGTYNLLPGTHFIADRSLNPFRRLSWAIQRYATVAHQVKVTDLVSDGCWRAGDALILDNKLLIQPEENKLFKSGTYLLVKYEPASIAPNSVYWSGKVTFRFAKLLQWIGDLSNPH